MRACSGSRRRLFIVHLLIHIFRSCLAIVCEHHPVLRLAICEVPLPIPRYSQGIRGRDFRCVLVVYLLRRSCLGFIANLKGQSETWSTHRKSVMYEVMAHPPCEVVLKMRIDEGRTSGWCVCLKGSLQSGCLWPGALCGCQTATENNAAKVRRLISQLDMASRHPIIVAGRLT